MGAEAEDTGEEAAETGLSACGNVARMRAAGSLGIVSVPFCPQAVNKLSRVIQTKPTIRKNLNINEFYLPC